MSGQTVEVIDSLVTVRRLPKRGTCHPIVVAGEMDTCGSPRLREALEAILSGNGDDFGTGDRIVIHTERGEFSLEDGSSFLSAGLEFIDASGLGAMVGALKRARERGGSILLVIPTPSIKRVFEITGFDKVFDIFDKPEAAYQMAMA